MNTYNWEEQPAPILDKTFAFTWLAISIFLATFWITLFMVISKGN